MLPLLLGCHYMQALESAPYVLSTGLGELDAIAGGPDGTAFVAGGNGVIEIAGDGKPTLVLEGDARLVALQPDRIFAVQGDVLRWIPTKKSFAGAVGGAQALAGIVDLLGWCDGDLLVAYADHLALWRVGQEGERPFGTPVAGIEAIARGPQGCASALALSGTALWSIPANGAAVKLVDDLVAPRAVASDRLGRAWIVSGDPVGLGRLDGSTVTSVAPDLGDVRDLLFGHDGMYAPQNAYLAERDGRIEYVHIEDIPAR
jgi:hypothetical protein